MGFVPIVKYSASGYLKGARIRRSEDGDHLVVTLGQDVIEQYFPKGDVFLRMSVGTGSDSGKMVLHPMQGGYKLMRDDTGKGSIRFKNPKVAKSFCNGHHEIPCTVLKFDHGGILLCGNNRG